MVRNAQDIWEDGSREQHGGAEPFLFSSESVGEGHPDVPKTGEKIFLREKKSPQTPRRFRPVFSEKFLKHVGYDDITKGIDCKSCEIELAIDEQNPEIANGVHKDKHEEEIGAGDQGLMFGYASDETEECMPLTIMLAHKLNSKLAELRRNGTFPWAGPDTKSQVTCEYVFEHGATVPLRVHTVVISTQHTDDITLDLLREEVMNRVILEVIPKQYLDDQTIYYINPCGRFVTGGPMADAGLTGRKIIVDTYGGWGAHGGGAFSGKDPTKVDRSAAYAARWVAKSLVAAGLCRRCLVQLSYAIGIAEPLSISIFSYGTSDKTTKELLQIVKDNFDLRPGKIIKELKLQTPFYQKTCVYGHFGRQEFPWEVPKTLIL
ncbi:S-adenosylmethionine synthase isoform type-2 like protein [Argiope bruennichi]|uniref:S-adenosylmethionine synthase n=1 Tax=Argiope bruennichi TaxID=94029 RepID=A0A8T0FC07_ARGBR|nr:S-adenosylmethionine synthase isoform type-2 like protein [Argiope bruennichi]